MSKKFKLVIGALAMAAVVAFSLAGAAFADAPDTIGNSANAGTGKQYLEETATCVHHFHNYQWAEQRGNRTCLGEPGVCEGEGAGEMYQWAEQRGNCTCSGGPGQCEGTGTAQHGGKNATVTAGHGEPGEGTGPGEMHHWGQGGEGASWGEPGEGTGPGGQRQWGRN